MLRISSSVSIVVRPSEQSSSRSPFCRSEKRGRFPTSALLPSRESTRVDPGDAAWAGVKVRLGWSLQCKRVVSRELDDGVGPDQIGATVADVRDEEAWVRQRQ